MSGCSSQIYFGERRLTDTADGSHTIELPDIGEHYHSTEGAIAEARYVYIKPCLKEALEQFVDEPLRVFEMGFGTGLNALLTMAEAEQSGRRIEYTTVEAFPLQDTLYGKLNYAEQLSISERQFLALHEAPWNRLVEITPFFSIMKIQTDIRDMFFPAEPTFHAVYYDAFAPQYQPELWDETVFKALKVSLVDGAILTTYCCKGDVKRALKTAGFNIEKIPGYGKKREMLRATVPTPSQYLG